jgi:HPt (histidine-containing phosphotransfer) domain-containing protein
MALYREVLLSFCKDVEERLPILKNVPKAAALPKFTTEVHALKSAAASIGAADISAMAAKLEAAGKAADIDYIRENLPGFAVHIAELSDGIRAWESAVKEESSQNGEAGPNGEQAAVTRLLHELAEALETEKAGDIDKILEELMRQTTDTETKEALEKISDNVLMTEFESAAEIVSSLLGKG